MERTPLSDITQQTRPVSTSCVVAAIALCVMAIGACHKANSPDQSRSLVIEEEFLIREAKGRPEAITRTASGGFVVVGVAASAWAAATDANGQFLWKYTVPTDPNVHFLIQSTFHGVVPLPSGGVLACGELFTSDNRQRSIIVILDGEGKLVEQRTILPKDDPSTRSSSFLSCAAWGDGFVLSGRWYDEKKRQAYYWLLKLDKDGVREWEKLGDELPGFDAAVNGDQNLTVVGIPVHAGAVQIARFNSKGDLLATRMTEFREAHVVRSVDPTNEVKVIGYNSGSHGVLLTLTGDLHDIRSKRIEWMLNGCTYLLPDGSVAIFGSKYFGAVPRAFVGWVDRHNAHDQIEPLSVPDLQDHSQMIGDAVPISPDQFVAIRDLGSAVNANDNGSVLTWVTFHGAAVGNAAVARPSEEPSTAPAAAVRSVSPAVQPIRTSGTTSDIWPIAPDKHLGFIKRIPDRDQVVLEVRNKNTIGVPNEIGVFNLTAHTESKWDVLTDALRERPATDFGGSEADWSPGAAKLLYATRSSVHWVSRDGNSTELHLQMPGKLNAPDGITSGMTAYALAADGERVAYVLYTRPIGAPPPGGFGKLYRDLMVQDTKGSPPISVWNDGALVLGPAWRPDGAAIAHTDADNKLVVSDLSGRILWSFHPGPPPRPGSVADYIEEIRWDPRGNRLAFLMGSPTQKIYIVNADGSATKVVEFRDRLGISADSSIRSFAWSPDGQKFVFRSEAGKSCNYTALAYKFETGDFPCIFSRDLFTADIDGSHLSKVTHKPDYDFGELFWIQ
jgi:hypothetical protein